MKINSEFIWEKNQREINEDALCICHVIYNGFPLMLAAICDGVGGLSHGEKASSFVISQIKKLFYQLPRNDTINLRKLSRLFCRCIYSCHEEINTGATTLCMVLIYKKKCIFISSGDTRAYIGTRRLHQITPNHINSLGQLTQAIGSGGYKKPYIASRYISSKTIILLCSDGFYNLNHLQITKKSHFKECTNSQQWLSCLSSMYYHAINNGEKDNSTAIAVWYEK